MSGAYKEMKEYEAAEVQHGLSRISLIKENSTLIFNDRFKIYFKHRNSFLLVWMVCKCMKNEDKYKSLGGIPPPELQALCMKMGYNANTVSINTRWYDEVRLKRNSKMAWHLYEVTDLKNGEIVSGNEIFLVQILQLIFPEKISAPKNTGLPKNTKLYTVSATPDQVDLFTTIGEAVREGYSEFGVNKITHYRYDAGVVGYLNWNHKFYVDSKGTAESKIFIKMINLSTIPLLCHSMPLWSDSEVFVSERHICAFDVNGEPLPVEIIVGEKGKNKRVEFVIHFKRALETGEVIDFSYSYDTPHTYKEGLEFFEWRFNHPHNHYQVEMDFDKIWRINNAVVSCDRDLDWFKVQQISKQCLKWERYFPKLHSIYKIEFFLERIK